MYLYVNEDCELVGFMPSNRGRVAQGHDTREIIDEMEIMLAMVPNDLVAQEGMTAKKLKDYVSDNGTLDTDRVPTEDVLRYTLAVMVDTLAGPMWDKQRDGLKSLADEYISGDLKADWAGRAASAINLNKRAVNSIMNERKYGWFIHGNPKAETAAEKAATVSFGTPVAGEDYGFARMASEKPELGVVSAESEKAKDEEHGVFYPRPDKTYIINEQIERLFTILETSSKRCPQNVNLIG
ncbi:hypothetical protein EBZ39_00005, partial [bacterium]|nr:hypothetical protein [bacterium]